MHDAMLAEQAGIRATAIMTERFVPTAQVMAQVSGMPGHPCAVMPHPIRHNTDAVLREKAADAQLPADRGHRGPLRMEPV